MEDGFMRRGILYQQGVSPYTETLELQQYLQDQRCLDPELSDILLLLQHPPVYTLGRGATLDFLKFDPEHPPAELHRIGRGGEVTYHCPGQLVGYPILNLAHHQQDLHWYLRQLEAVLIAVLADYGLTGERIEGLTGVWVEGHKVAAIGIQARRWITMHGFALNVCPAMEGFEQIVPCGIGDRAVGSMAQFISSINLADVQQCLVHHFGEIFQLAWQEIPATSQLSPLSRTPHSP